MASPPPLPRVLVPHPHVRCDIHVLGGSPHVIGSRVPVRRLWAWHRGGAAVETLMRRYPNLGPSRVLDALAFAYDNPELIEADLEREQKFFDRRGGPTVGARPLAQMSLPFEGDAPAQGGAPAPVSTPAASPAAKGRAKKSSRSKSN